MALHGGHGFLDVSTRIHAPRDGGLIVRVFRGHIAVQRVVGGGLIREHLRRDVPRDHAFEQINDVDMHANRDGAAFFGALQRTINGRVDAAAFDLVEILVVSAAFEARQIGVCNEAGAASEGDGKGLRAAHAAATAGDAQATRERATGWPALGPTGAGRACTLARVAAQSSGNPWHG